MISCTRTEQSNSGLSLALFLWPVEKDASAGLADICCDKIKIFSTGAGRSSYKAGLRPTNNVF